MNSKFNALIFKNSDGIYRASDEKWDLVGL